MPRINAAAPGAGAGASADDTGIKIKQFFEEPAYLLMTTKGHKFVFDGFQMIVTHERRFLDLIERILERLDADSSRQVEIETKFLEVQEGALDEVSFDWQYSWGDPQYVLDPETLNPVVDSNGQPVMVLERALLVMPNTCTAHSASGISRDTIISIPDNSDASLNIPNPTPTLPGKIAIGQGVSPLLSVTNEGSNHGGGLGSLILGGSQAKLLINALKENEGYGFIKCTTMPPLWMDIPAQITIAQEFIYPTDYEPAPLPGGGGGGGANLTGIGGLNPSNSNSKCNTTV